LSEHKLNEGAPLKLHFMNHPSLTYLGRQGNNVLATWLVLDMGWYSWGWDLCRG